ncbi:MAG TPA: SNF2-related protein, partial [Kofleriaceae bacterium]|nr:SNF2-related protein [Kofleriaceae bacterium]
MPRSGDIDALLEAIREAAPRAIWSQGVELVRRDVVAGESEDADEIVVRVAASPHGPAPTVVLYPKDQEWDCDCPSRIDCCVHVVAAALAVSKAREAGAGLPSSDAAGAHVRYRFVPADGGLALERDLVNGDQLTPLTGTLQTLVGRGDRSVAATQLDLQVDRFLGTKVRGRLADERLAQLFALLGASDQVFLGDERVRVSDEEVRPIAVLEDAGDGVRLRLERDPNITAVVASCVARVGDTLRPIAETRLSGRRLEALPFSKEYARAALGELASEVLPMLRRHTVLRVETARVPGLDARTPPRLAFDIAHEGQRLSVLATLVYGDPPRARVDGGRLVHLHGAVPVRDEAAERRLVLGLRSELSLVPGLRQFFAGADAAGFVDRLQRFQGGAPSGGSAPLPTHRLAARIVLDGATFQVVFEAEDGTEVPGREGLAAWRGGMGVVSLPGGGFGRLPLDWLEQHGAAVAALLAARDSRGELPPQVLPRLAVLCDELGQPRPPIVDRIAPLLADFRGLPRADLPPDLAAELRPYQRQGVDWLAFLRDAHLGGILADDMGLGKTVQALAALRGRALVVCPNSLLHNWALEAARFRPGVSVALYHGAGRALDPTAGLTVTTYGVLRQDADELASV